MQLITFKCFHSIQGVGHWQWRWCRRWCTRQCWCRATAGVGANGPSLELKGLSVWVSFCRHGCNGGPYSKHVAAVFPLSPTAFANTIAVTGLQDLHAGYVCVVAATNCSKAHTLEHSTEWRNSITAVHAHAGKQNEQERRQEMFVDCRRTREGPQGAHPGALLFFWRYSIHWHACMQAGRQVVKQAKIG